jgi:hypothetical protein
MTKDEQIKGMANPNRGSVGVQEAQPQRTEQENITDGGKCWCDPELDYKDPNTGVEVWIHKDLQ